jgi:hypothetical protein
MNVLLNTAFALTAMSGFLQTVAQPGAVPLLVRKCTDFDLTGKGDHPEWNKSGWNLLTKLDKGGKDYESKFKILYSTKGIYLLFMGEDDRITTRDYQDQGNLFFDDVFEVFFHPDPAIPRYFEFEVNQMGKQLVLMISNLNGQRKSWGPWHHEGKDESGIRKLVDVAGGPRELNSKIQSWSAEVFFPFETLGLLPGVPPRSGAVWNANFCRLDYDTGPNPSIKWSWTPAIKTSFHELEKFRSIKFE